MPIKKMEEADPALSLNVYSNGIRYAAVLAVPEPMLWLLIQIEA